MMGAELRQRNHAYNWKKKKEHNGAPSNVKWNLTKLRWLTDRIELLE